MITLFVAAVVVSKNNNNYPFFIVALMFVQSFSQQITSTALSTIFAANGPLLVRRLKLWRLSHAEFNF